MNALLHFNRRLAPNCSPFAADIDNLLAGMHRPAQTGSRLAATPIRIDVAEDEKAYRVSAALAGVKKEDIHVAVDQNEVTISADIKQETSTTEGARVLHSERYYGKTTRVFSVGQDIDEANVQAKYADGVLSLVLPKKAPVSAKRVMVE